MNVWSAEVPTVWGRATGSTMVPWVYVVRGPNAPERTLYAWRDAYMSVGAWCERHGFELDALVLVDGHPPCIFCGRDARYHVPSWYGQLCRPTCVVQGCDRNTCVQAVVNGYQPACLHHFFSERVMRHAGAA